MTQIAFIKLVRDKRREVSVHAAPERYLIGSGGGGGGGGGCSGAGGEGRDWSGENSNDGFRGTAVLLAL